MAVKSYTHQPGPDETVAVVGMACTFPDAPDLATFWRNIIHKHDAVGDAPPERWDPDRFYDPHSQDGTKLYAKRGGYLDSPFQFNPAEFGIMPKAVDGGEPDQFLVLKTAADAMRDAGIEPGGAANDRTAFILGRGSYLSAGAFNLVQRTFIVDQTVRLVGQMHPDMPDDALSDLRGGLMASLKPFDAETAPSVMPNITAGRVANRLGLMGPNYTIDAACASSLYAVDAAISGLLSGRSDLALAGGVHIFNNIPFLNVFCTLGAMSHQDQIRPFDENADGMLPGEGAGVVVLKRTSDARRDGNRIYAVIRGVGSSSDGRGISVAAPKVEGEVLALERAYQAAGVSPATIGLIEAHGTATTVGDTAEIKSLTTVFGKKTDIAARHCALGSVKSMIGHAMPAAGIASLIKTVLSLYHKVLPPTLHCERPNSKFELETTPFYVNTETRPWFRMDGETPRRAGVNAFGFGGVNAHVVLEEYEPPAEDQAALPAVSATGADASCGLAWDTMLFLLSDVSRAGLVTACNNLLATLDNNPSMDIVDFMALSHGLLRRYTPDEQRLAVIADSAEDLAKKLDYAVTRLQAPNCKKIKDIKGIYYFGSPLGKTGKVVFMFPGEGAAYTNMMMDLCLQFPAVRDAFDTMNMTIAGREKKSRYLPSQFIFPATLLSEAEAGALEDEFWKVDSGLQAILTSSLAMLDLLDGFDIKPDMMVGHSAGEYSSWIAAGILDKDDLYANQEKIAAIYADHRHDVDTAMVAVSAGIKKVGPVLETIEGEIYMSNDNCPHQVVVLGETGAMERFKAALTEARLMYTDLPSREVHHTPMAEHQAEPLRTVFSALRVSAAEIPVYSPFTAAPYPAMSDDIIDLMVRYWLNPLRFRQTVDAMYADGARIFIEVGPGNNLCGFVDDILRGKSFMSVPANTSRRSGTAQLCHLLGMLAAQHVNVNLAPLLTAQQASVQDDALDDGAAGKMSMTVPMDLGLPELHLDETTLAAWRDRIKPVEKKAPAADTPASASTDGPPVAESTERHHLEMHEQPLNQSETGRSRVMKQYMDTMSKFLGLQKEMTMALAAGNKPKAPDGGGTIPSRGPMIGRVTVADIPSRVCIERHIDLRGDVFLYDHPFGGDVSLVDDRLSPLIVTPLALNVEMMTEAAAQLFAGKVVTGIKNVKASRWVVVDEDDGVQLTVEARAKGDKTAETALYDRSAGNTPSTEGTVMVDIGYPPPETGALAPAALADTDAVNRARAMYSEKLMTHGPRFQVITAIIHTEQNEMIAGLRTPDTYGLFASGDKGSFLINPLLLDACAQITGYWAQHTLNERFITFPAGLGEARFVSPPPGGGDRLWCRMRIRDITDYFVRSDLTIVHGNGNIWARVTGWTHRRFELPLELYRFWRYPCREVISRVSRDARDGNGLQCTASYYGNIKGTVWQKAIGYLYLNRAERRQYGEKLRKGDDTVQWLSERIAAKDAVRTFAQEHRGIWLAPADIAIARGENGFLVPKSSSVPGIEDQIRLSATHSPDSVTVKVNSIKASQHYSTTATTEQEVMQHG
ncbi:MAG: beta-ketoacyl synthase N-terminal-like domain-containing protein [Thermodesulfobacteriota bacterium]|nr:beta-ketoacyl synthase N-terminal-like domain-containing protein [Thermodesulfobacteriota bacterium]